MSAHDVDAYIGAVEEPKRSTLAKSRQTPAHTQTPGALHFALDEPLPLELIAKLIAARLREAGVRV